MSSIVTAPGPSSVCAPCSASRCRRDGVKLSTDVYLPEGSGPFPVILIRTPYSNNADYLVRTASTSPSGATPSRSRTCGAASTRRVNGPRSSTRPRMATTRRIGAGPSLGRPGRWAPAGLVPRAHPVAGGAAPEPPPRRDGAARGVLEPVPQLGLHGRRFPARLQPPMGRRSDEHAHESDPVPLDAARSSTTHPVLAPPLLTGDERAGRVRSSTASGSATRTTGRTGNATGTSRRTTSGSTCRPTGSAGGTTSSCRDPEQLHGRPGQGVSERARRQKVLIGPWIHSLGSAGPRAGPATSTSAPRAWWTSAGRSFAGSTTGSAGSTTGS